MRKKQRSKMKAAGNRYTLARILVIHLLLAVNFGCFLNSGSDSYDYTDQVSQVESVSYIQVTMIDSYAQGNESDIFQYSVLETFNPTSTETILKDLAALKYHYPMGHPFFVNDSRQGVLIKFKSDSTDLVCVLYCQYGYVVVRKCDRGIQVDNYGPYCDEGQWKKFMEKYVEEAH